MRYKLQARPRPGVVGKFAWQTPDPSDVPLVRFEFDNREAALAARGSVRRTRTAYDWRVYDNVTGLTLL